MPRDVLVSKALSKLLRHSAEKEGLKLDEAGYINLKDVVGLLELLISTSRSRILSLFQLSYSGYLSCLREISN